MLFPVRYQLEPTVLSDHGQWLEQVRQIQSSDIPTLTNIREIHPHLRILTHETVPSAIVSLPLQNDHEWPPGHLLAAEESCEQSLLSWASSGTNLPWGHPPPHMLAALDAS